MNGRNLLNGQHGQNALFKDNVTHWKLYSTLPIHATNFKSSWQPKVVKVDKGSLCTRKSSQYSAVIFWAYIDWCHSVPGGKLELLLLPIRSQMSDTLQAFCKKKKRKREIKHELIVIKLYVFLKEEDPKNWKESQKIGRKPVIQTLFYTILKTI